MRDAIVAEWILRLVTTPDRASSTVGDLIEEAPGRGVFWFWSSVFGTALAQVWQDMRQARLRMLWLGFSGWLEAFVVAGIFLSSAIRIWVEFWPPRVAPDAVHALPWGFYGLRIAVHTLVPIMVGWDVARRSGRREVAAAFALILALAIPTTATALSSGTSVSRYESLYPYVLYASSAEALSFMTGALLRRIQANKRYFGRAF